MTAELLYANAPLLEVVAEVRWELVKLKALPDAAVDPHFTTTAQALTRLMAESGFASVETLLPPEVPLELIPGQVVYRYRREPNAWPLFQFGPGVFAVNIVPPYKGWTSFRPAIAQGLELLLTAHPSPERLMKLNFMNLRYIDAFRKAHGRGDAYSFLTEDLGLSANISGPAREQLGLATPSRVSLELEFTGTAVEATRLVVKARPGERDGEEATLLELGAVRDGGELPPPSANLAAWFDEAHGLLSQAFQAITSARVKTAMGEQRPVPN